MAYTDKEIEKLISLTKEIEENNNKLYPDREYSSTFRDIPLLNEIEEIIARHDAPDESFDSFSVYNWIADRYEFMERFSIAVGYYEKAFDSFCRFNEYFSGDGSDYFDAEEGSYEAAMDDLENTIQTIAKLRNIYEDEDDDCSDIIEKASLLLPRDRVENAIGYGKRSAFVRYDPVEKTDEYLAVIDEIEEMIDNEFGAKNERGKCYAIWAMKRDALAERGIKWHRRDITHSGGMVGMLMD